MPSEARSAIVPVVSMFHLVWIAFGAGGLIALQAALNARLGALLGNPRAAAAVVFGVATLAMLAWLLVDPGRLPSSRKLAAVPGYLWIVGGLTSAFALSLLYGIIPRIGAGTAVAAALSGQLMVAALVGHLGWFGLPSNPLDGTRALGLAVIGAGMLLVTR